MHGDNWADLSKKFSAAVRGDSLFTVVYLGDSHVQADFGGSVLRERLIAASRPAGRGIILPFKLASTNQPLDYHFGIKSEYVSSKLMKMPWSAPMCFTGAVCQPMTRNFKFNFSSKHAFSKLRLHTRGTIPEIKGVSSENMNIAFSAYKDSLGLLCLDLENAVDNVDISFSSDRTTVFGGVELLVDTVGTVVHSIGNNGATFSAYGTIEHFGSELSTLSPDLIIIALGTNEAFGKVSVDAFTMQIDNLVKSVKMHSPKSKILLVGPTECYRKTYRYVRRNGKRRRVSSTVVNTKAATIAKAIRLYGEAEGIPYYNHYALAGGAGAAAKMKSAKVLSSDGVHFTAAGYRLWGNLLADAVLSELLQ